MGQKPAIRVVQSSDKTGQIILGTQTSRLTQRQVRGGGACWHDNAIWRQQRGCDAAHQLKVWMRLLTRTEHARASSRPHPSPPSSSRQRYGEATLGTGNVPLAARPLQVLNLERDDQGGLEVTSWVKVRERRKSHERTWAKCAHSFIFHVRNVWRLNSQIWCD